MFIAIFGGFCLSLNRFLSRSLESDRNEDILSDSRHLLYVYKLQCAPAGACQSLCDLEMVSFVVKKY
jgi:hypothetical protein